MPLWFIKHLDPPSATGSAHFLGGTDQFEEGVWEWDDGTAVGMGMPFWYPGQPNLAEEDCLAMYGSDGYFHDVPCDDSYNFICQDFS